MLVGLVTEVMQRRMIAGQGSAPSAPRPTDCQKNSHPATGSPDRSRSSTDPMDAPSKADLEAAEVYGRRVAEIALKISHENNP